MNIPLEIHDIDKYKYEIYDIKRYIYIYEYYIFFALMCRTLI